MKVGVVAIGRNESPRLRECLLSAVKESPAVVYVDSGSADDSVALARSLGAAVVELDQSKPFTAARARNEGFARLMQMDPQIDAVQFVDGDCAIAAGWISRAAAELSARPKLAVVCGRRRERYPNASIYNRLCDMEWNTPIGPAQSCGGDALIRTEAFKQVGGYDASVIAGEEPEMCFRLREKGWSIQRIDAEMTLHDAAMTKFSQWWKRNIRAGHAYAQANAMHGGPPECFRRRELASIRFWVFAPLVMMCAVFFASLFGFRSWWALLPLGLYPFLAVRIALRRAARGQRLADALWYGIAVVIGKFPQYLGIRSFQSAQRRGRQNSIMEYKVPAAQLAAQGGHDSK